MWADECLCLWASLRMIVGRYRYDPDTGLYLDTNGATFPTLPQRPTRDDARAAIDQLKTVVEDFPFAKDCHRSAWLSAVLSVVCRSTIQGCVPMHGITATAPGSGKSLLSDIIAIIGTGRPAARWSQVTDEEEERKRLFTVALSGSPLLVIDNVTHPLGSGTLCQAITASSVTERMLRTMEEWEAPFLAVVLCTGNNVQYVNDLPRRVVPIALDPKMERPEERTGFQHPNLLAWLKQERPGLTIAALTIVKAYFEASCPAPGVTPLGSFEAWSDLIRQALVWAGEVDPCEGRKDIKEGSNPEFDRLDALLQAWHTCYGTKAATLKRAVQDIGLYAVKQQGEPGNSWNDLYDALSDFDERYDGRTLNTRSIGKGFSSIAGRVIGKIRLIQDGTYQGVAQWRIATLD